MNFARGLLNDPWILFLDEPTLGLDVAAARQVRELVVAWKAAVPGRTVLLTTHYMAEADELCERIAIVDHGRILAIGIARRAQAAGPARVDLPARARPTRRRPVARWPACPASCRRSAAPRSTAADVDRQTVAINLVLVDDGALGGVVGALGGPGLAHPRAPASRSPPRGRLRRARRSRLRRRPTTARRRPDRPPVGHRSERAHRRRHVDDRRPEAGRGRLTDVGLRVPPHREPAGGRRLDAAPGADHRPALGRRPRLSARHRPVPREVVAALRDPAAVPRDLGLRLRLPVARRRRRSTSGSSSWAGR